MTKRDLISIALKVVGVVFLAQALVAVPQSVRMVVIFLSPNTTGIGDPGTAIAVTVLSVVVFLSVSWVLIALADRIALKLVPGDEQVAVPETTGRERPLFSLALRVVGVVLLAEAVPGVFRVLAQALFESRHTAERLGSSLIEAFAASAWATLWSSVVGWGVTVVVGMYLVLGARHLVDFAFRTRVIEADQP